MQTKKSYNPRQPKVIAMLILLAACLLNANVYSQSKELDKLQVQNIITALADSVKRNYVEEKTADGLHAQLNKLLKDGAYENVTNAVELSTLLTKQLIAFSNDKHFGVDFTAATAGNVQRRMPGNYNHLAPYNYYFNKMEILPGNIGLLEIGQFVPTDYTGQLLVAAMNFFSNSDALIIDLRNCVGGDPRTVVQLAGCFFKDPVLFHVSHNRGANTRDEFWTTKTSFQATEKGKIAFTSHTEKEINANYNKLATMPVYVLTSNATFSAGEGMAYGLQTRKRATIVGENTGHGGNGIRPFALPHGFVAFIPFTQMVSPLDGSGFQLTGVLPDIATSPAKALDTAYTTALQHLIDEATDEATKTRLKWEMRIHMLRKQGVLKTDAHRHAGSYGEREVSYEDGELYYQRDGSNKKHLQRLTGNYYLLDRQTLIEFSADYQAVIIHQMNGSSKHYDRTNKTAKQQ